MGAEEQSACVAVPLPAGTRSRYRTGPNMIKHNTICSDRMLIPLKLISKLPVNKSAGLKPASGAAIFQPAFKQTLDNSKWQASFGSCTRRPAAQQRHQVARGRSSSHVASYLSSRPQPRSHRWPMAPLLPARVNSPCLPPGHRAIAVAIVASPATPRA